MTKSYLALLMLLLAQTAFAQLALKGTVHDSNGQPLPGVSVYVLGTTTGTFTDASGT